MAGKTKAAYRKQIRSELDKLSKSSMKIGELLTEARELFNSQKDFLEWSQEEVGIKKSQTFALMRVWATFKDKDLKVISHLSSTVLILLAGRDPEVVNEVISNTDPQKPPTVTDVKGIIKSVVDKTKDLGPSSPPEPPEPPKGSSAPKLDSPTETRLKALEKENKELRDQLEKILASKEKEKFTPKAVPGLPQFKSEDYKVVLGLYDACDEKAVKHAYRTFVRVWNEDTNKTAFKQLTAAKDNALEALVRRAA